MKFVTLDNAIEEIVSTFIERGLMFNNEHVLQYLVSQCNCGEIELADCTLQIHEDGVGFDIPIEYVLRQAQELAYVKMVSLLTEEEEPLQIKEESECLAPEIARQLTEAAQQATGSSVEFEFEEIEEELPEESEAVVAEEDRVMTYVYRSYDRGVVPTIKMVQSALKGLPVSSDHIREICMDHNYRVEDGPAASSHIYPDPNRLQ